MGKKACGTIRRSPVTLDQCVPTIPLFVGSKQREVW